MKPIKKVALLHDMCGVGKAASTNMIPILSVMGIEACPIPTVLLSTHTGGYGMPAMHKVDPDYITQCANHYVANNVIFDVIFVGYIGNIEMIESIAYFLFCFPTSKVIIDPIMGDYGVFYNNFNKTYCNALCSLFVYADVLIPNLTECCLLTDTEYNGTNTPQKSKLFSSKLKEFNIDIIIITSVPVGKSEKGIVVYHDGQFTALENEEELSDYHGTGDTFDGVFIGSILQGQTVMESIQRAHDFVCACIKESDLYEYNKREGLIIEKNLHMLV